MTRRNFIKTSAQATLGGAVAAGFPQIGTAAAATAELRLGLIGCGGRGSGAAKQALTADKNVVLTAVGDAFESQLKPSLANLQNDKEIGARVKVKPGNCFVGIDAYQKVIESGVDVVILASPPGFRPVHIEAAVNAGKHIFAEKPMATDAPGVRAVLKSAQKAKEKGLSLVAGFCWRYEPGRREFYKRVHGGAIGDVRFIHATYLTGPVKPMPPASSRPAGMGDLEWQLRNWYNFVWLSGDGLAEQACHSVDKIMWGMKDVPPIKAMANGGRNISNNEGNIFDHIDVFYEWENGARACMAQRQISYCSDDNSDYLNGAKGNGDIRGWNAPVIRGETSWAYSGDKKNMYQVEHDELFASIRSGKPINDGQWMAQSTLAAIMGRMAAYTGQEITWEMAMNSKEQLVPDALSWDMKLPIAPMAVPGKTKYL